MAATIDGISIELSQVKQTAATIRTRNTSLDQKLGEIRNEINSLANVWQSDASETFRGKFSAFADARFPEYRKIIESYAQFLDSTVEAYTQNEAKINASASSF